MKIFYDCELRRPACVLIQAALGGDAVAAQAFDPAHWLLAPTPGMRLYEVDEGRLAKLVRMTQGGADAAR